MTTVVELRKKCKDLNLKGYSKLKKHELEELLKKYEPKQTSLQKGTPHKTEQQQLKEGRKKKTAQQQIKAVKKSVLPQQQQLKDVKKKVATKKRKDAKKKDAEQKVFGLEWSHYRWIERTYKDSDGYTCIKLYDNVRLFRGNKTKTELKNRETYFAPWHGTTIGYIPKKGTGYMEIYELKNKNLKLFDLSSVENINRLLRETFHNKEEYNMIKKITMGKTVMAGFEASPHPQLIRFAKYFSQLETDNQPYQFKTLLRTSIIKEDFKFGQWLCKRNFDGYAARDMYDSRDFPIKFPSFPAEIMLCTPKNDVQLVKCIPTHRYKTTTEMQESIGRQYLNPGILKNLHK